MEIDLTTIDNLIERFELDLQVSNESHSTVVDVLTTINDEGGISSTEAFAIDKFNHGVARFNVNGFTTFPTDTNIELGLEGIAGAIGSVLGGIMRALYAFISGIFKVLLAPFKWLFGSGSSDSAITNSAASAVASSESLREVVKESTFSAMDVLKKYPTDIFKHVHLAKTHVILSKRMDRIPELSSDFKMLKEYVEVFETINTQALSLFDALAEERMRADEGGAEQVPDLLLHHTSQMYAKIAKSKFSFFDKEFGNVKFKITDDWSNLSAMYDSVKAYNKEFIELRKEAVSEKEYIKAITPMIHLLENPKEIERVMDLKMVAMSTKLQDMIESLARKFDTDKDRIYATTMETYKDSSLKHKEIPAIKSSYVQSTKMLRIMGLTLTEILKSFLIYSKEVDSVFNTIDLCGRTIKRKLVTMDAE